MKTKKERHEIYKKAIAHDQLYMFGICFVVSKIVGNNECYYRMGTEYPELYLFRPEENTPPNSYWNYGRADQLKTRKVILQFCIEMTK